MRHQIILYPDKNIRFLFQNLISTLNTQYNFVFNLFQEDEILEKIIISNSIDFNEEKCKLSQFKRENNFLESDTVILLTLHTLNDSQYSVQNLFLAGQTLNEENQCTSIISLKNIGWDLFKETYNYEIQKHSIFHLVVCCLISTYTDLVPHKDTNGCLLDQNMEISGFRSKVSNGYFFCSEKDCISNISKSPIGLSILHLCHILKSEIVSNNYIKIPINDVRTEILNASINSPEYFQDFILKIYNYAVKKPIEHWGFYNFLWNNDEKPVSEKQAQIALNALFKIVLELKSISIGKEVEASCGFVDFLLSYNSNATLFKVGIEVKNAHNRDVENGYNQLIRYLDSENTKHGILIILWYKNDKFNFPTGFSSIENLEQHFETFNNKEYKISTLVIDCTKKPSPSKPL
ncbi:hypothetical protein [Flavobacterium microcysteis]